MGEGDPPGSGSIPARRWDLPTTLERERGRVLARALSLPTCAGEALVRRGLLDVDEADRALSVGADDLHDPALLPDATAAARRLCAAIGAQERIVVHGDYDADGICGTALLTRGLRRLGAVVEPFVPDRQRDGYGVAQRLIEHCGQAGVRILITVDTGSSAHEAFARAQALGIEVVVCDHHLFDERPVGITWFVNPHRPDSQYPHTALCGSAIAYKLLQEVARLRGQDALEELPFAAIATVADQVDLVRENRALVQAGLVALGRTEIPGLRALLEVCRASTGTPGAEDVAFQIAPRLNAAGRIEKARTALDLLLAPGPAQARALAAQVDRLNEERKALDRDCADEALEVAAQLVASRDPAALVLASERWHRGVVGIAAARVVGRFHRPALLLALEGDTAVGSARSAGGIDLKAALDGCADLLIRYGGHAAAAGATVARDRIEALGARFHEVVRGMDGDSTPPVVRVDGILGPEDLAPQLAEFLYALGPYGAAHPALCFAGLGLGHGRAPRVVGNGHLRLDLSHGGRPQGFIGFGKADAWMVTAVESSALDVVFTARHRPASAFDEWELTLSALRASEGEYGSR